MIKIYEPTERYFNFNGIKILHPLKAEIYIEDNGDYYIDLYAYNMETVLAEKIETMLSRLELNGRTRDFYDIYLIYKKEWQNINIDHFRKAIDKTFTKREYNGNPFEALDIIRNMHVNTSCG